ncbi:MAG: class I lanthipeptide [Candidatus Omnitrophota bacterium]
MYPKKFEKKLVLNKLTISNLERSETHLVKGGAPLTITCTACDTIKVTCVQITCDPNYACDQPITEPEYCW